MPQVKEPLIRTLVKKALKEAELTVGDDNTKFSIKVSVSNPQSETKLGIRIQLKPKSEEFLFTNQDKKGALSVAIMKKLNSSLGEYDIQVSKDTDAETQDPTVLGFFIPLSQIKNMIVKSLGGTPENTPPQGQNIPKPPTPTNRPTSPVISKDDDELKEQEDPLDRAARLAKEPLPGMSKMTGLGMKRSMYQGEKGGELTLEELFEKLGTAYELLLDVFKDIYKSDYKFKDYYTNNEDEITRTMGAIAMMKDDVEDRIEAKEPVGPDKGIEEIKKVIKSQLNEMRQRDLNEISKVVIKEDFYNFINAGNNVLRSLEENGMQNGKKYLMYLVKHNIM